MSDSDGTGDNAPIGQRFSLLYLDRGRAAEDSERLRRRLYAHHRDMSNWDKLREELGKTIEQELGVRMPTGSYGGFIFETFFEGAAIRDILDAVTLVWRIMDRRARAYQGQAKNYERQVAEYLAFVRRAFEEENVGYRIDDSGVVHYFVDEEFEANRQSAVQALQANRYRAALNEFQDAHKALNENPSDTKRAIRSTFEAAEILFKLIANNQANRLNAQHLDRYLKPIVINLYAGNNAATDSATKMLESFKDWINGAHNYRHGQGVEESLPAPDDIAVLMVSAGASFIRWLAEIDQRNRPA